MAGRMVIGEESRATRREIYPLNWVRMVAALAVVLYHCRDTLLLPKYFAVDIGYLLQSGASGVQLFFVLSGFVIYYAHGQDPERSSRAIGLFLKKRFLRLYPPLWIVLSGMVLILSLGMIGQKPDSWDLISSYLILPANPDGDEPILAVEWTLRHEVLFYILFTLALWHRAFGLATITLWAVAGSAIFSVLDAHWSLEFMFDINHLLFFLGLIVGIVHRHGLERFSRTALAAGVVIFCGTWFSSAQQLIPAKASVPAYGVGSALIIYGLVSVPRLNTPNRVVDLLGAASYSLYLIHYPLLSILSKTAKALDGVVHLPPVALAAAMVVICQLAAILFHLMIERPMVKWLRASARITRVEPPASA